MALRSNPDSIPRVSVLMAVYNGECYLAEALDTLLAQTLTDFELVVVDDASTDGTAAVLSDYAERDDRVVVLRNEENRRLAASLNRGLAACRAPLVARADADDVYAPERLERQVAFLDAHPEVGLLSTACIKVYEKGGEERLVHPEADAEIRMRDLFVNSFLHPGVMFRSDLVRHVGGYDESLWTAQDVDLWSRLRPITGMANLVEPLVRYRVHGTQTTKTRGGEGEAMSLMVRQRVLSGYLGREVGASAARAAVSLYRGTDPLSKAEVEEGLTVFRDVAQAATAPASAQYHREAVGKALLRQAAHQFSRDVVFAGRLLSEAVRWSPRSLGPFVFSRMQHRAQRLRGALRRRLPSP